MVAKNTTDTFTNKTMDGDYNTFLNLPAAAFAAMTSAELAAIVSDETGSGVLVFATSPTLVTPVLGVATATSVNKVALTAPATAATLTLANGSTLATSGAYSITLTATAATNVTLPTSGTLLANALTDGKIFVGNASNVATGVTPTGDVTITNAGVTAIAAGVIVDADINGSAAIAGSKLQAANGSSNAGAVSTSAQSFAGLKTFSDGIFLGSAGDTLDYFATYEASFTFTGGGTWSQSATVSMSRTGNVVYLVVRALGNAASTSTADIAASTGIPSRFRPSATRSTHCTVFNNSTYGDGVMQITSAGVISFRNGASGSAAAWTAANNKGVIRDTAFVYTVT